MLRKAQRGKYAVGAFNISNLEAFQAVMRAAASQHSPVIVATSQGAIEYAGIRQLAAMAHAEDSRITLHLDHGRDMAVIKRCLAAGWTSVMYDGSHLPFKKNIKQTKRVATLAHKQGVNVEGELGTIGGAEDTAATRRIIYTDPDAAKEFVECTGVDALAVAIGTSHGAYKFSGKPRLDMARLRAIRAALTIPLVLHGASGVPQWLVRRAQKAGAHLGHPVGVPDAQIRQAIQYGISKVNIDTDLRLAFVCAVREILRKDRAVIDPRRVLGPARDLMQRVVENRMRVFGSARRA